MCLELELRKISGREHGMVKWREEKTVEINLLAEIRHWLRSIRWWFGGGIACRDRTQLFRYCDSITKFLCFSFRFLCISHLLESIYVQFFALRFGKLSFCLLQVAAAA